MLKIKRLSTKIQLILFTNKIRKYYKTKSLERNHFPLNTIKTIFQLIYFDILFN